VLTLGRLVNDLHTLAMSDLQTLSCHFDQVDATSFLTTLLDKFALRAEPQQLTVTCDISPLRGVIATWDTVRLEQLFTNLFENSLRYTDAPGRIMVTTSLRDSMVTICIDDSAPGAPDDTLPRLFEPLFRLDAARARRADASGGSGLGLAICQAIVQAHGGSIIAESSALGGVRIAVSLPCTQPIHP
jgi:two-component system, OmpR family, sensor histidine kinase BaeS